MSKLNRLERKALSSKYPLCTFGVETQREILALIDSEREKAVAEKLEMIRKRSRSRIMTSDDVEEDMHGSDSGYGDHE